jgi:hypothetical protein
MVASVWGVQELAKLRVRHFLINNTSGLLFPYRSWEFLGVSTSCGILVPLCFSPAFSSIGACFFFTHAYFPLQGVALSGIWGVEENMDT